MRLAFRVKILLQKLQVWLSSMCTLTITEEFDLLQNNKMNNKTKVNTGYRTDLIGYHDRPDTGTGYSVLRRPSDYR
jgi:hypothetical protein